MKYKDDGVTRRKGKILEDLHNGSAWVLVSIYLPIFSDTGRMWYSINFQVE